MPPQSSFPYLLRRFLDEVTGAHFITCHVEAVVPPHTVFTEQSVTTEITRAYMIFLSDFNSSCNINVHINQLVCHQQSVRFVTNHGQQMTGLICAVTFKNMRWSRR